jgi:hypothetical protein
MTIDTNQDLLFVDPLDMPFDQIPPKTWLAIAQFDSPCPCGLMTAADCAGECGWADRDRSGPTDS